MSEVIKTAGGSYTPEELASAYNEQRDLIAELKREKINTAAYTQRLEASAERHDALVQALKPLVEDSVSGLDHRVEALEVSLQESDFDELRAKVDDMTDAMRRASDAFSDF